MMTDLKFYDGKKILVTGHTGFKGSWLCQILVKLGARVTGYSLMPAVTQNLYDLCGIKNNINSVIGDIRDIKHLQEIFQKEQPELVIHLAAQPIVRESYQNPVYTYETNVLGTVNVCECIRLNCCVKSFLNVTTDKVYDNREWERGYNEADILDGKDPYSNSKSCSELVTSGYKRAFFENGTTAVSTARAGNVIGGGDFAIDRIIPDCIRASEKCQDIKVRNPDSVRPYQHVLEPLMLYLEILQKQYLERKYEGCYNVGPDDADCITTGQLAELFCEKWGNSQQWINISEANQPHEANFLKLDCSKARNTFGWKSQWNIEKAVEKTVEWHKCYMEGKDVVECMNHQIFEYLKYQQPDREMGK